MRFRGYPLDSKHGVDNNQIDSLKPWSLSYKPWFLSIFKYSVFRWVVF